MDRILRRILTFFIFCSLIFPTASIVDASLSRPQLKNPQNNAELTSIPTLEWSSVPGAQGYNWEISTSTGIDDTGYFFVDSVCYGSTGSTYANVRCGLQENVWYYWHVWAVADGQPGALSETWRFKIIKMNHHPVLAHTWMSPGSGTTEDTYVYYAKYRDEDNDAPAVIIVCIDGVSHNMVAVDSSDTDYTDGKEYQYETTLTEGTHNYYIYCEDGKGGSCRSPNSGTSSGPTVSATSPPTVTIKKFTISPTSVRPGDHVGYNYELTGNGQPGTVEIVIYSPANQKVHSLEKVYDAITIVTSSAALWQVSSDAEFGIYTVILTVTSQGKVIATKQATFEVVIPTCTLTFVEDNIFFEVGSYKEYAVEISCEGDGYITILDVSYSTVTDMGISIVSKPGKINAGEIGKVILGLSSKSDVEKTIGFYLNIDYEDSYGQKGRAETEITIKLLPTQIQQAELVIVSEAIPASLEVNEEAVLSITVKADSNDVTNLQARLTTEPDYITVLTDKTVHYGTLSENMEHTFSWRIKALEEGNSQIKITITGDNIDEKEIRKTIVLTITGIDLYLSNLTISHKTPQKGENIEISVIVYNTGNLDLDVPVKFFDGNPSDPSSTTIDSMTIKVGGNNQKLVKTTWNAYPGGTHTLYIVVDPDNGIPEADEQNNTIYEKIVEPTTPPAKFHLIHTAFIDGQYLNLYMSGDTTGFQQILNSGKNWDQLPRYIDALKVEDSQGNIVSDARAVMILYDFMSLKIDQKAQIMVLQDNLSFFSIQNLFEEQNLRLETVNAGLDLYGKTRVFSMMTNELFTWMGITSPQQKEDLIAKVLLEAFHQKYPEDRSAEHGATSVFTVIAFMCTTYGTYGDTYALPHAREYLKTLQHTPVNYLEDTDLTKQVLELIKADSRIATQEQRNLLANLFSELFQEMAASTDNPNKTPHEAMKDELMHELVVLEKLKVLKIFLEIESRKDPNFDLSLIEGVNRTIEIQNSYVVSLIALQKALEPESIDQDTFSIYQQSVEDTLVFLGRAGLSIGTNVLITKVVTPLAIEKIIMVIGPSQFGLVGQTAVTQAASFGASVISSVIGGFEFGALFANVDEVQSDINNAVLAGLFLNILNDYCLKYHRLLVTNEVQVGFQRLERISDDSMYTYVFLRSMTYELWGYYNVKIYESRSSILYGWMHGLTHQDYDWVLDRGVEAYTYARLSYENDASTISVICELSEKFVTDISSLTSFYVPLSFIPVRSSEKEIEVYSNVNISYFGNLLSTVSHIYLKIETLLTGSFVQLIADFFSRESGSNTYHTDVGTNSLRMTDLKVEFGEPGDLIPQFPPDFEPSLGTGIYGVSDYLLGGYNELKPYRFSGETLLDSKSASFDILVDVPDMFVTHVEYPFYSSPADIVKMTYYIYSFMDSPVQVRIGQTFKSGQNVGEGKLVTVYPGHNAVTQTVVIPYTSYGVALFAVGLHTPDWSSAYDFTDYIYPVFVENTYDMYYGNDSLIVSLGSPAGLHVYDSQGRHVGLNAAGEIEEEIPGSHYFEKNEIVIIVVENAQDVYRIEITGDEDGVYHLSVNQPVDVAVQSGKSQQSRLVIPINAEIKKGETQAVEYDKGELSRNLNEQILEIAKEKSAKGINEETESEIIIEASEKVVGSLDTDGDGTPDVKDATPIFIKREIPLYLLIIVGLAMLGMGAYIGRKTLKRAVTRIELPTISGKKTEAKITVHGKSYNLTGSPLTIGRGKDANIRIDDPDQVVSRVHAKIFKDSGQYWIEDMNSRHGTFVYQNNQYKKIQKWALYDEDVIVLCYDPKKGKGLPLMYETVKSGKPVKTKVTGKEAEVTVGGKRIPLTKKIMTIGRSDKADIRIDDPYQLVSRMHARILEDDGQYWIEDTNSKHGTFVYQNCQYKKIQKWALYNGDVIVLCHGVEGGKEFPIKFRKQEK